MLVLRVAAVLRPHGRRVVGIPVKTQLMSRMRVAMFMLHHRVMRMNVRWMVRMPRADNRVTVAQLMLRHGLAQGSLGNRSRIGRAAHVARSKAAVIPRQLPVRICMIVVRYVPAAVLLVD
jgi:hypothetical protein